MITNALTLYLSLFHGGLTSILIGAFITVLGISGIYQVLVAIAGIFKTKDENKKEEAVQESKGQVLSRPQKIIEILLSLNMIYKIKGSQKNTARWSVNEKTLNDNFKITNNGKRFEFLEPKARALTENIKFDTATLNKLSTELPLKFGKAGIIPYECIVSNEKINEDIVDTIKALYKKSGAPLPELEVKGKVMYISEARYTELKFLATKLENKAVLDFLKNNEYFGQIVCNWEKGFGGWIYFNVLTNDIIKQLNFEKQLKACGLYFEESVGNDDRITFPKISFLESGDIVITKNKEEDFLNLTDTNLQKKIFTFLNQWFNVDCRFVAPIDKMSWLVTILKPRKDIIFYNYNKASNRYSGSPVILYNKPNNTVNLRTIFSEEEFADYNELTSGVKAYTQEEADRLDNFKSRIAAVEANQPAFKFDTSLIKPNGDLEKRLERIIDICVELSNKKIGREEVFFMGEILNPEQQLPKNFLMNPAVETSSQMFMPISDLKHFMVIGGTGSGKTTSMLSFIYVWASICKKLEGDVKVYVADGKNSPDFKIIADYLSDYDYAGTIKDPIVELNNILVEVWGEYKRRQALFNEYEVKDIYAYRELGHKLPRIFVIIDEFAVFKANMGDFSSDASMGSPEQIILDLARQARSYGITLFLLGQSPKVETFPNVLKENLTTKIFHKLEAKTSVYAEEWCIAYKPVNMQKGQFIMIGDGVTCPSTSYNEFVMATPFLGDYGPKYLFGKNFEIKKHKPFEYDLIVNSSKPELDIRSDKTSLETISKFFKKRILDVEGWTVEESFDLKSVSAKVFGYVYKKGNQKIAFGFLGKDRLTPNLFIVPEFQRIEEKHRPDMYIFLCNFATDSAADSKKIKEIQTIYGADIRFQKSHFLEKNAYMPFVVDAEDGFIEQNPAKQQNFDTLLTMIMQKENPESHILVQQQMTNPLLEMNVGDRCKANVQITPHFITKFIGGLDNNQEKGEWFELFVAKLYEKFGYETWLVNELLDDKLSEYERPNGNTTGDGGGDVIIQDRKTGKRRLIQCKAYFAEGLSVSKDAYDEVMRARKYYNCDEVEIITNNSYGTDGFSNPLLNVIKGYHLGGVKFTGRVISDLLNLKVEPNEPLLVLTGGSGLTKLITEYNKIEHEEKSLTVSEEQAVDYLFVENNKSAFCKDLLAIKLTQKNQQELETKFSMFCMAMMAKVMKNSGMDYQFKIDAKNKMIIQSSINGTVKDIYYCSFGKDLDTTHLTQLKEYAKNFKDSRLVFLTTASLKFDEYSIVEQKYGVKIFDIKSIDKLVNSFATMEETKEEDLDIDDEDLDELQEIDLGMDEALSEDELQALASSTLDMLDEEILNSASSDPFLDDDFLSELGAIAEERGSEIVSLPKETKEDKKSAGGRKQKLRTPEDIATLYAKEKTNSKVGKKSAKDKAERDLIYQEFLSKINEQISKEGQILEVTDFPEINGFISNYNKHLLQL